MNVIIKDQDSGEVLFQEEAIYIDQLLGNCQRGRDLDAPDSIRQWLPLFTQEINRIHNVELTDTTCYLIALETTRQIQELKKSFAQMQTSQPVTESIPSV